VDDQLGSPPVAAARVAMDVQVSSAQGNLEFHSSIPTCTARAQDPVSGYSGSQNVIISRTALTLSNQVSGKFRRVVSSGASSFIDDTYSNSRALLAHVSIINTVP
jgi:hypothetical protein